MSRFRRTHAEYNLEGEETTRSDLVETDRPGVPRLGHDALSQGSPGQEFQLLASGDPDEAR